MIALKNQLTFNNFMDNFDELTSEATPKLFRLFNSYIDIDIDALISSSFKEKYYSTVDSPREYSLSSMINFLSLKIFFDSHNQSNYLIYFVFLMI